MRQVEEGAFSRYFLFCDLCAVIFAAWLVLLVLGAGDILETALQLAWLLCLIVLFSRKRRDEFAQHCWGKAAEAAFAMLIVSPVVAGFIAGLIDGFAGRERNVDWTIDAVFAAVFATFFITFEWTRFREGRA